MASIGTGYDLSASTYSPDGRVFQVEYALKAVENSPTVVGVCCKDGVVLGIEKLIQSPLLVKNSNKKIHTPALHVGIAATGLLADIRHFSNRAQEEAAQYENIYRQPIPGSMLADRLGQFVQTYTLYSSVRPFGMCALVATMNDYHGPELYAVEPSGIYWGYNAYAFGKGRQVAKTELEKLDFKSLTVIEAVKQVARIIHIAHDEAKDKDFELEMSWISAGTQQRHEFVPKELVEEANQYAKDSLNNEMED